MKFAISAFTDVGTVRDSNQDRILTNGKLTDDGRTDLADQDSCVCFVADGVGGNKRGDFASEFILRGISSISSFDNLEQQLRTMNAELVRITSPRSEVAGTATTLTGLVATDNIFRIIHVGDSQLWLQREGTLFKVTNDQVLNEYEGNSPLTSFFGGSDADLKFDTDLFVNEFVIDDLFLVCSDGLSKSLSHKSIKAILVEELELQSKAQKLLSECRANGAEDNVSVILIQRTD
jgi:serine/threonine protein phosphatase PrpC